MGEPLPSRIMMIEPAIETLFALRKKSLWPQYVLDDSKIIYETGIRRDIYIKLDDIFKQIPDPSTEITDAIQTGVVNAEMIADLYHLLTTFLDTDPYHKRLILYFPFELLPPMHWRVRSTRLQESSEHFIHSYMRCWRELLEETDIRANFVDGNIFESQLAPQGQLPVRKAAHLIPQLVKKGYISHSEILKLMDIASNKILRDSVNDTLCTFDFDKKRSEGIDRTIEKNWFQILSEEIALELKKLDMRESLDLSRGMPQLRVEWERQNNEENLVANYAKRVKKIIVADNTVLKDLFSYVSVYQTIPHRVILRGISEAIEILNGTHREEAKKVTVKFLEHIRSKGIDTDVRDEIMRTMMHISDLRLITEKDLESFDFGLPRLDAIFSTESHLAKELTEFTGVVKYFTQTPEAKRLFYPIIMFFGSRFKHYAQQNSDLDVAVFVRPGISKRERSKVHNILAEVFPNSTIKGKVVEFWLQEKGEVLSIRNFKNPDVFLADNTWVHVLMSSVWLGEEKSLEEMYTKLLPRFLYSKNKTSTGYHSRKSWLSEMECEVLQYRLMHKGYRRFFVPRCCVDQRLKKLDPKSTFWDSGYRRLATKLFVSRVFLPQLILQKK